ncbi:MAG: 2Fe-2S iron-sulfur cluster-binding protein [Aurantimonas endophytica]|uniref:2Fe-2S iron-sulfur cluster-binding protein n=1 Tax=Aurantimonas endophytica TaxID=1522175 RepID=UPI00300189AF
MATEAAARIGEAVRPIFWDRESDAELDCIEARAETQDVKTFTFRSPAGRHFSFGAGQFFIFEVVIGSETHSRCYSLSSSPLRTGEVSITVKRVPGGIVSNWLHDNLVPGTRIRAIGPLGQFTLPSAQTTKLLLLSAGSGITPVMSMAREMADRGEAGDVVFLHAGRTPKDLIFREELGAIAGQLDGFRLLYLPETIANERGWHGLTGRISSAFVSLAVPDIAERLVMCCGPAPFMAEARRIAAASGVPAANYREESFDAAVIEEAPAPLAEAASEMSFGVTFSKQGRTIEVLAEQTVLAAARKAGVKLPSSCANGICGTCKSKLTSGSVDMKHGGGIRQREIDAGFFLPCCSKPLSDIVIER